MKKKLIVKLSLLEGRCSKRKGKTHKDRLKGVLKTLLVAMYAKLRNLATSTRRHKQWTAKDLRLKFIRRKRPLKSMTTSINIPLVTEERELGIVNFWHEIPAPHFKHKVFEACSFELDSKTFKTSKDVILEARKFKRIRLFPWVDELPHGYQEEYYKEMDVRGIPHDPYLPYYEDPGKFYDHLPLNKIIGDKNLRQTTLDEYFRPKDANKIKK